jgi:hypothetical protein
MSTPPTNNIPGSLFRAATALVSPSLAGPAAVASQVAQPALDAFRQMACSLPGCQACQQQGADGTSDSQQSGSPQNAQAASGGCEGGACQGAGGAGAEGQAGGGGKAGGGGEQKRGPLAGFFDLFKGLFGF